MQLKILVMAAVLASAVPFTVHGQILTERNISLPLALNIANAAMAACKGDGYDVSAAVVDRAGDLKVLLRADTANPHNADLARRKAYTAVAAKMARVVYAVITTGTDYRRFPEATRPGGRIPSPRAVEAHATS